MEEFENNVKFGIFESYSHYFGPHSIGCAFPINKAEIVAITMKETILFEGEEIKSRARYNFCAGCYIPEVTLIVAHTYRGSELFAMQINDLANPILSNFPTDQVGVYHMIYSPKSHAILTIGTGIKVWNISWVDLGKKMFTTNSKVIITLRSTFALTYDSPMLNPPDFDYESERLYLPTPEGIRGFNLDGFPCDLITRLPADTSTIYAFCPHNKKVVTSDPVNGVIIWKKGAEMDKRITTLGPTILSIGFIDPQNILYLNAGGSLFLINVKASRPFHCYDSPQMPTRLSIIKLYDRPHVTFCIRSTFRLLKVVIPWKVWNLNISRPKMIARTPKYNCAAQIVTQTDNSFIKLYSPQTRRPLVSTTPSEATTPKNYFYDRGTFVEYKYDELSLSYLEQAVQTAPDEPRDYLFVTFDNGILINYDMSCVPCNEIWSSKMNALCVEMIKSPDHDSWLYAVGRSDGGLSLLDYHTFKEVRTVSVCKEKIIGMLYHYHSNCIVFVLENKLQLLDLKTYQIIDSIRYHFTEFYAMHGNTIYLGGKEGEIERYEILNHHFVAGQSDIETKPHTERVTSFSFGKKYYLSASIDSTFMLWNYEHDKIALVTVPFPIYSISFLGPRREILLGMDTEVMIMDPTVLFGDEVDPEIEIIDNYDRKDDLLDPELLAMKAIQEEEKKKQLINALFANTIAPETKRHRNFFRNALLKYQQEQQLLQQKGQQLFEKGVSAEIPNNDRNNQFGGANNLLDDKDNNVKNNNKSSSNNQQKDKQSSVQNDNNNGQPNTDSNKETKNYNKVKRKKVKKNNNENNDKDDNKADPDKALDLLNQMGNNNKDHKKSSSGKKHGVDISKMNFAANAENGKNQQDDSNTKQKGDENNEDDDENDDKDKEKKKSKSKGKGSSSKQEKQKNSSNQKSKQNEKDKQKEKEAEKAKENEKQKQKPKEKENEKDKKNAAKNNDNKKADKNQKKQSSPSPTKEAAKQKSSSNSPSKFQPQQQQQEQQEDKPTTSTSNNEIVDPENSGTTAITNNTNANNNDTNDSKDNTGSNNRQPKTSISKNDVKQPSTGNNNPVSNKGKENNSNQPNATKVNNNNNSNSKEAKQPNSITSSTNNGKDPAEIGKNNRTGNLSNDKDKTTNDPSKSSPTSAIDGKENGVKEIIDKPPNPAIVDEKGNVLGSLSINSEGKPVNNKGEVLDNVFVDKNDNFVNEKGEYVNEKGEPIDPSEKIKYVSIASQYDYVNEDGSPIPTDEIEKEMQKDLQASIEMDRTTNDKAKEQIKEFHEAYSIQSQPGGKVTTDQQQQQEEQDQQEEQEEQEGEHEKGQDDGEKQLDNNEGDHDNDLADDSAKLTRMIDDKQKVERPSTPPPVRWRVTDDQNDPSSFQFEPTNRRSCRTPPLKRKWKRWQKKEDNLPPPNIVLDPEAILSMFGRGHTELLPLIERIKRDYVSYQTHIAPLPIVVKQGKAFRVIRPTFDASGSRANVRFLLFPDNQFNDKNNNRSYSNFNTDSYNSYNYRNLPASVKTFKPRVYKVVAKPRKKREEQKSISKNDSIPVISLNPVDLSSSQTKEPSTVHFHKFDADADDGATSFGPISPRPPSDRLSSTYSPHRKFDASNRNPISMENQRGFQIKPLNIQRNAEGETENENDDDDEEGEIKDSFIINKPKSARRQRRPYDEVSCLDNKSNDDELKRPNSLRLNRNINSNEFVPQAHKSSDENDPHTFNPIINPPGTRPATIKDYTFLLDSDSPRTSNKMSSSLRDMFPMTTKGPVKDDTRHMIKNLYKGGGYLVGGGGCYQANGMTRKFPNDLSYSMKLTRPNVKRKNSPNPVRRSNQLSNFFNETANEI